ncbi:MULTISPECIES: Gfo/Idh/MocA family protein [unclassified Lentimonas]|uniref:Gfo/Idh/MocA family protein n=1 Tax=unclassified Lentimonas TaxID=2630993 RepID=UPI001329E7BB|nr:MULTISPECIES: Gfo/Idh/MocA family oxidoreductase [unclassified Lentimonas]CAA6680222.1 Unannotated [Lentimonas sp. CC4]CAA6687505.1 Unannotated [Lentimonas sp. CC6]CAA7076159.1 Unannotated [Lentimonas sp. CC4]CAA7171972.1 Unannotated [Lentimonas sp. CC21]CAA7183180.1 Unannotated [Lentimonas sp. CC8]
MSPLSRRNFIKQSAVVGAGAFVLPRFSIGKPGGSPNSKLNIAMIGHGDIVGMAYNGLKGHNIVAIADVDQRTFSKHADKHSGAQTFTDYRRMLDRMGKEIDGVCINTPDHIHFPATIDAMERGLHVCTQKPLAHNIWQCRTLKKAKDKYGVVTNMANQGHTYHGIRQMREWVEADVFGDIKEVHLGTNGPNWNSRYFALPEGDRIGSDVVPQDLDWDLWLGPQSDRHFNKAYHPLTWRGFYDFGTGQFGDWFCHIGDGPVWILDLYEPFAVECIEKGPTLVDGMVPNNSLIKFEFKARGSKAPCTMYWYDGMNNGGSKIKHCPEWDMGKVPGNGSYWYGTKQNGYLDGRSNNPRLTTKQANLDFNKGADIPETYERLHGVKGPFDEWARCIQGELKECGSNFDYAAPMTEVALIGLIAQRFGGRIEWDPAKGITNRPELNAYVKEPTRRGWEYGMNLWK